MSQTRLVLCLAAAALFSGPSSAFAQGVISQKALSLDLAQNIARAALEQCRANGYHATVTIVDTAGLVKVTLRDDGTSPQTVEVSRKKAYTAMIYRRSSGETLKAWQAAPPAPNIEGTIGLAGGLPIMAGKDIVGGLGVSGAPGGERDEACGAAALAKVADALK